MGQPGASQETPAQASPEVAFCDQRAKGYVLLTLSHEDAKADYIAVSTILSREFTAQPVARFAVSPGYTHKIGQACHDLGLPLLPGVATGSEVLMCQEDGLNELKFFPAMQAGGVPMLKALGGPFGDVRFCPTGGVTLQNAPEFLALPNVVCVGGSWLVPGDALAQGDWARVTRLASEAAGLRRKAG